MNIRRKRIISALLVTVLVVVTGCSKTSSTADTTATSSAKPTESSAASAKPETLAPITFKFFSEDPNPNWSNMQDRVGKAITAKTGVKLDAEFAVGDPAQKVALIAASGQYPDLINAKGDAGKLIDAGALIDLTDLINKYAPNIKKVYGDYMKRLRYSNKDKSIYVIPTYSAVNETRFEAGGGFELQHAVVKEAGYPKISTLADYEKVIKAYKDKHPTVDGKPTLGLSLNSDDWHMYISVTNPASDTTGGSGDGEYYIDPKTNEASYHFRRPVEKEYFKWLNHMNAIGLLDPESFVQKYDQYKAKVATGRVLGLIDQNWDYQDGERALKTAGKFDLTYGHYPVTLNDTMKQHDFQDTGFMSGWGIAITKDCKDPVRAIKFLDYLASDEAQILDNWGVEGIDYDVVNGKRVIKPEILDRKVKDLTNYTKESGVSFYYNYQAHYGDGAKDTNGDYYTTRFPEQLISEYSVADKETLSHYNAKIYKDLFPTEKDFPVKAWGAAWNINIPADDEVSILANKMKDITWKRIPEAILAKPEKFDEIWDSYQNDLVKAGVEKMEKGFTVFLKDRIKLWNEQ
jgi:putative aldouronate transport system substrate-binding protein